MFSVCRVAIYPFRITSPRVVRQTSLINLFKYSTQSTLPRPEEIPAHLEKIYEAPLAQRIKKVKLLSFFSSILGIPLQPVLLQKMMENPEKMVFLSSFFIFLSAFTWGSPILIHKIVQKYVIWVYYDQSENKYTLYTYSFFLKLLPYTFVADEVTLSPIGPFSNVKIRDQAFFLDSNCFSDLDHYKKMMKYDREINFKLEEKDTPKSEENLPKLERPTLPPDINENLALNLKKPKKTKSLQK